MSRKDGVRSEDLEDPLVFSTAPVSVEQKSGTQDLRTVRGKLIQFTKNNIDFLWDFLPRLAEKHAIDI